VWPQVPLTSDDLGLLSVLEVRSRTSGDFLSPSNDPICYQVPLPFGLTKKAHALARRSTFIFTP